MLNLLVVWFTEVFTYLEMQTELWDCLWLWRKMIKTKWPVRTFGQYTTRFKNNKSKDLKWKKNNHTCQPSPRNCHSLDFGTISRSLDHIWKISRFSCFWNHLPITFLSLKLITKQFFSSHVYIFSRWRSVTLSLGTRKFLVIFGTFCQL